MFFGEREVEIGVIDAEATVSLIKFVVLVMNEIEEDEKMAVAQAVKGGRLLGLINVLSPLHLYKLTSIVSGVPEKEVKECWNIILFTELLAELSEKNDLPAILKNLQRAVVALKSLTLP